MAQSKLEIHWLREYRAAKDTLMASVAGVQGSGKALWRKPLSFVDFPETEGRVDAALARAKKPPTGATSGFFKRLQIRLAYNGARRYFAARPQAAALCWNGITGVRMAFMQGAKDAGARTLYAELAPFAGYMTLDPAGINAEGSVPVDVTAFDGVEVQSETLQDLALSMSARAPRRSDVTQREPSAGFGAEESYIFVPLQVPDDSQIRLFAGWAGDLEAFITTLASVSRQLPDGWHLRVKEHPSAKQSFTGQIEAAIAGGARMVLDNATDSMAQMRNAKAVLTINSSMGLQAFFYDLPVIVTGRAFYALPGLAQAPSNAEELAKMLSRPDALGFDHDLRARFLSWLITCYYVPLRGERPDPDAVLRVLSGEAGREN